MHWTRARGGREHREGGGGGGGGPQPPRAGEGVSLARFLGVHFYLGPCPTYLLHSPRHSTPQRLVHAKGSAFTFRNSRPCRRAGMCSRWPGPQPVLGLALGQVSLLRRCDCLCSVLFCSYRSVPTTGQGPGFVPQLPSVSGSRLFVMCSFLNAPLPIRIED